MNRLTWRRLPVAGALVVVAAWTTPADGQTGESPAQVVTVRAGDGLIEVRGPDGGVTRAFGASSEHLNVRVSTGDLFRTGSPLVLTAVSGRREPCRLAWDPDTGQALELSWSNGGFFALDVAGSAGKAFTALERRSESGSPEGSIMECTDPRSGTVLFHSEWFHEVTAVATGELLANPGQEIVTTDRAGNIRIWQHGRLGGGIPPILKEIVADGVKHLDVAVGQVLAGEGPVVVTCDRSGRILIYHPSDARLLATQ